MLALWLTNISLSLALAASSPLVNPNTDPDVQPHIQRGYFMMDPQAQPASSMTLELSRKISQDFLKQFESRLHAKGLQFSVKVDWENKWFAAHANFDKKSSSVVLWGGFLRAPGMNDLMFLRVTLAKQRTNRAGDKFTSYLSRIAIDCNQTISKASIRVIPY